MYVMRNSRRTSAEEWRISIDFGSAEEADRQHEWVMQHLSPLPEEYSRGYTKLMLVVKSADMVNLIADHMFGTITKYAAGFKFEAVVSEGPTV